MLHNTPFLQDFMARYNYPGKRVTYIQTSRLFKTQDKTSVGVCFEASPVVWGNTVVIGTTSGSVFGLKIA